MTFKALIQCLLISLSLFVTISCARKSNKRSVPQPAPPTTNVGPVPVVDQPKDQDLGGEFLTAEDNAGFEKWRNSPTLRCSAADAMPSLASHANDADASGSAKTRFINNSSLEKKLTDDGIALEANGSFVQLATLTNTNLNGESQTYTTTGPRGPITVKAMLFGQHCTIEILSTKETKGVLQATISTIISPTVEIKSSFKPGSVINLQSNAVGTTPTPAKNIDRKNLKGEYLRVGSLGNILWLNDAWNQLLAPQPEQHKDHLASLLEIPKEDVTQLVVINRENKIPSPALINIESGAKDPLPIFDDFNVILPKDYTANLKLTFQLANLYSKAPNFQVTAELRDLNLTVNANNINSTLTSQFVGTGASPLVLTADESTQAALACAQTQLSQALFYETAAKPRAPYTTLLQACETYDRNLLDAIAKDKDLLLNVMNYALKDGPYTELPESSMDWIPEVARLVGKSYSPTQGYNPVIFQTQTNIHLSSRLQTLVNKLKAPLPLHEAMRNDFELYIVRLGLWVDANVPDKTFTNCADLQKTSGMQADAVLDNLLNLAVPFGDLATSFQPVLKATFQGSYTSANTNLPYLCIPTGIQHRAKSIGQDTALQTALRTLRDQMKRLEIYSFSSYWGSAADPSPLMGSHLYRSLAEGITGPSIATSLEDVAVTANNHAEAIKKAADRTEAHRNEVPKDQQERIVSVFQETSLMEAWTDSDYANAEALADQTALFLPNANSTLCKAKGLFIQIKCQWPSWSSWYDNNIFSKQNYLRPLYQALTPDVLRLQEKFSKTSSPVPGFIFRYRSGTWLTCTDAEVEAKHALIKTQLDQPVDRFEKDYLVLSRSCS